ncbi:Galactose/methyl galactoside import ATP-binding protein MglA [Tepidimonas sediminis]|uniref:Galactose/methyl galactoside import ATP-binding protein MglA n=1 Tax=Tepidimonas sediminis TaxID=2588941 RepID=A0A554WR98_9BURK|nr:ABC transporter ATP-binding protein [Tepidimonas sediminis]TSE26101.1 Galactose/methyl galactoside import ATP-binding protein MglA [Tepidimonas sediminis]
MSPPIPRLELRDVTKRYPGVVANDRVSLTVRPGSIHAVLGENGAGKSTLMKIIYGVVPPDEGVMRLDGREVRVRSPQQARELGIGMVFQHFSLFETLTVADNVWLGLEDVASRAEVVAAIRDKAAAYGLELDPERPVHSLSVGERQRVEIVRALLARPRLLILDEPTSVLTPQAVQRLFGVLRQLAAEGCSILYISHKLHEIRALCDACTVMRGGRVTGEVDPRQASDAELSRLMIGREPPPLPAQRRPPGEVVLRVAGLTLPSPYAFGTDLHDVNLELRAGEIVGIAGVSGNGQRELLAALSGEEPGAPPGALLLDGRDLARANPARRRRLGLHFVPEERLGRGAVPALGLAHNLLLTRTETVARGGWLRLGALRTQAVGIIERYGVKAAGPDAAAQSLSGGNLQKFIVGREIEARPRVLIVAQPTWGVDVGAAAQIRAALLALREAGCAVLVVSEELDELFELCDRLHVIAKGHLSPSVPVQEASVERLGAWMAGQWPGSPLAAGQEVSDAAA